MIVSFSAVDCSTATTYKEEAIIPDVCVETVMGDRSFKWQCSDKTFNYYDGASCGGVIHSSIDVSSGCVSVGTNTFVPLGFWDEQSACLSITYSNPTSDPTQGASLYPRINPSHQQRLQRSCNPRENP
eukprot:303591_1